MTKVEIIEQILLIEPQFKGFKCRLGSFKKIKILVKIKREKGGKNNVN